MKTEELARQMRERAILLELDPELTEADFHAKRMKYTKIRQRNRIEEIKKLYFNAGRWAGGARDHNAREAFEKMNKLESK